MAGRVSHCRSLICKPIHGPVMLSEEKHLRLFPPPQNRQSKIDNRKFASQLPFRLLPSYFLILTFSYSSLFPQTLRRWDVSLESCPTCGYALSTLDRHCRHCPPSGSTWANDGPSSLSAFRPFDAKNRSKTIITLVGFSMVLYWILFR